MRQALGPGALGRPRGIGWRGRWEGGSGKKKKLRVKPDTWQESNTCSLNLFFPLKID